MRKHKDQALNHEVLIADNLCLNVSVAHSLFVHKTYTNLIYYRPLLVVMAWDIFRSIMGVLCVLCSNVSVLWPDMYTSLFHTNCVEVFNTFRQCGFEV